MDFKNDVLQKSHSNPVIVDFYADWCAPCKVIKPIISSVIQNKEGIDLVLVDVDKHQDVAQTYGIRSIPSIYLFKDGKPLSRYPGEPNKHRFTQWVDSLLQN